MAAGWRKPNTGTAEKNRGGGDGKRTRTPAAETARVPGAKPERLGSDEYGLLELEAPGGDQYNIARLEGRGRTKGSPVDTEAIDTEDEAW